MDRRPIRVKKVCGFKNIQIRVNIDCQHIRFLVSSGNARPHKGALRDDTNRLVWTGSLTALMWRAVSVIGFTGFVWTEGRFV